MYYTINQIEFANHKAGKFFFSKGAMDFFKSKVYSDVIPTGGGAYFVTSEKDFNSDRLFTLRFASKEGNVTTVGKFQAYGTKAQALKVAKALAKADPFIANSQKNLDFRAET